MAVMRQFPPPLPSITPIGIFIHIAQVTNFVSNSGTWPVYDVTTQTLIEEDTDTGGGGATTSQTTTGTETSTSHKYLRLDCLCPNYLRYEGSRNDLKLFLNTPCKLQ